MDESAANARPAPPPAPDEAVWWTAIAGWTLGLGTGPAIKQALYFSALPESRSAVGMAAGFLFFAAVVGLFSHPVGVWAARWAMRVRDRRGETWPTRPTAFLAAYLPALILGATPAVSIRVF